MIDILMPKGNENEMIDMAIRLGFKELIFAYESMPKEFGSIDKKGLLIYPAQLCMKNSSINKKQISILKGKDGVREFFEKGGNIAFDIEIDDKADQTYLRNSGLNQVIGHIAKEKNALIGYSFNSIIKQDKHRLSTLMGRISQNIRFCDKFKVSSLIFSFASKPFEMRARGEMDAVARSLGMEQRSIKDSVEALNELIERIYIRKDYDLPAGMRTVQENG